MNSVTKTDPTILGMMLNGSTHRPSTSNIWETVYIEMATGEYDHEREILETAGFSTVICAEDKQALDPETPFDSMMGYFDDYGMEVLWDYVDTVMERSPRNRMYLGWMTSTTHMPFMINPEWVEKSYQGFIKDDSEWSSLDRWLNAIRWTDDKVKEIILGFRERGLENETLFIMYPSPLSVQNQF